jgi:hypothetical protein
VVSDGKEVVSQVNLLAAECYDLLGDGYGVHDEVKRLARS